MRQVLMQRGSHSFIRYCASESVFAGLRRIAKLATSIAIAVAFSGIALPTPSAQAQSATFAVGETTFAENETSSVTLTLDNLPTDQDISSAEVELIFTNAGFGTPSGTTYTGTSFAVTVTGDNTITPMPVAQPTRIRVAAAISPGDTTAAITWTIQPADISSNVTFTARRPGGKHIIFKDSNGNPVTVAGLRQPALRQAFTITTVANDNAILLSYTFQNGDTIPNIKTETPTNTSAVGVDWNPLVGINLLKSATAMYSDGTKYACDEASSSNCLISFPSGLIENGGPVHATIPVVLPTQDEQGREFEIGKQVIPGTSATVVFNPAIIGEETRGHPRFPTPPEEELSDFRPLYRSIAEDDDPVRVVAAFNQTFGSVPADITARCTYGLGGDALYGEDYHIVDSSSTNLPITALDAASPPPLRVVENDATNLAADNADNHLLINDACNTSSPVITWSVRLVGDNVVKGNKRIAFVLREVQLFNSESNPLGVLAITQPDTLVLTVVEDDDIADRPVLSFDVSDSSTADGASITELSSAQYFLFVDREAADVVVDYSILGDGVTASDFTFSGPAAETVISDISANNDIVGTPNILTQTSACAAITDMRCGTIALADNITVNTKGLSNRITITYEEDSLAETDEVVTLTLYPRLDDDGVGTSVFPNSDALADRSRSFTFTDNDPTPTELTPAGIMGVSFVVIEQSAARPTTSLNSTFTLSSKTDATLGYELTGPGAGDIAVTHGSGDTANRTTVTPNVNDPRKGTFTVTGTTGTSGSLQLTAEADNILEGTKPFTLTLFAGNPDNTRLELANGEKDYDITDSTPAVIPTLTWPGRTNIDPEDRDRGTLCEDTRTACDETLPIGPTTFPGGVLEGSTPHLLVALPDTVVAIDTVIPIITSSELDALVEPLYFDENNRAVRAVIIPAGRSRASARVRIVSDHLSESPDEEVTFTLDEPVSGITEAEGILYADTLPATIIINDRPAVGANAVTWTPVTGQVDPGVGETHVANLTIRVDGGFTSDREAVSIYFETLADDVASNLSDLGEVSWKRAGSENVLPVISRNHIAVSRFNFSPASESDSTPVVTVGLYFTPKALISAGQQVEVNLTRVNVINRSAGLGLSPIRAILCNDNDDVPDEDGCDGYEFNAGDPKYGISGFTHASEVGPTDGGFNLTIAEEFRTPSSGTPTGTINYSVGGTALRGITRDYTLEITATDPDNSNANTTGALTTTTFGEVSIPFANLDNVISFTVRPVADAINERTETVVITIEGIRFTGNDPAAITDSRVLTVNIANAPVPVMQLSSSDTFLLLAGAENPDAPVRTGRNNDDIRGDDQRFNIPSVRLRVTPAPGAVFPEEAFYATIAYTVDPDSTATFGVGEDYTIARETTLASEPTPVGGLGTSSSFTLSRDSTDAGPQIDRSTGISNLDFWLNINDDSTLEPPETVIMNFTTTLFACASGLNGANTACTGGQAETPLGLPIPFTLSFLINDNDGVAITGVRTTPPVVNEDARNSADRRVLVELLGNFDSRIVINRDVEIDYNITDASGGAITDNTLGVTAADFTIPDQIRNNRGASDCTTARLSQDERDAGVIICRGTITAIGNTNQHIEIDIVDDDDGENEEAFYVNFEAKTVATGAGEREIAAGTRVLVTIADSDGGGPVPILGPTATLSGTGGSLLADGTATSTFNVNLTNIDPDLTGLMTDGFVEFTLNLTGTAARNISARNDNSVETDDYTIDFSDNIDESQTDLNPGAVTLYVPVAAFEDNMPIGDDKGEETVTFTFSFKNTAVSADNAIVSLASAQPVDSARAAVTGGDITATGRDITYSVATAPGVSIEATEPIAVELSSLGLVTFTLSEASMEDTTVTFTSTGTGVRGDCAVVSNTGFCSGGFAPANTITHALATRTGDQEPYTYALLPAARDGSDDVVPEGPTTITIPAGDTTYEMVVIPVAESGTATDPDESAIITVMLPINNDDENIVVGTPAAATVTVRDPGRAALTRFGGVSILSVGGINQYSVNLDDVGVEAATGVPPAILNRAGGNPIDAVFELRFPTNPGFNTLPEDLEGDPSARTNAIIGDNYHVFLRDRNVDDTNAYDITLLAGNVLRVVVKQARLVVTGGGTGPNAAGGEQFRFDVVPQREVATGSINLSAYTILAGSDVTDADNRRDTLNTSESNNTFSAIGAPTVTLTSGLTLTDGARVISTDSTANALALTFTNPFNILLTNPTITYTLSISPTDADGDGSDAANTPFAGHFEITPAGGSVVEMFATPADDDTARTFTVTQEVTGTLALLTAADALNVALKALPFSGGNRTFNIDLINVEMVSGNVTRINTAPAAAQSVPVSVAETSMPLAELRLTGPRSVEPNGGALGATTIAIDLGNVPANGTGTEATRDVVAAGITLDFGESTADDIFTALATPDFVLSGRPSDTNPPVGSGTTVFFDFPVTPGDGDRTISLTITTVAATAGETIVPSISAVEYFDSLDAGPGDKIDTLTLTAERIIQDEAAADRTFTIVAEGEAPRVSLLPENDSQSIASENGSFADITASLANLPATIGTSPTATVGSVRLTLTAESTGFATTVSDEGKTILFSGEDIRLTLPTEIEGLVFIPNSLGDDVQVSVPAGTTEFAIRATAPAGGDGDTMKITEVAYYNDASPPAEISDAPPPHFALFGSGIIIADDAVVATLSADGPTTIGTGGGVLGMTEFSLTLTNLDANDDARIPLTLSDNGTPMGNGGATASGTNYDVEILSTTGDGDPDAAIFASGVPPSVRLTAAADGTVTVNFRITSTSTANTPAALPHDFTVSIGEISVEDDEALPNPREEVVQTASLAYEIIAAGMVRSVSFDPADLTVMEGDSMGTTVDLTGIPTEIPPDVIGSPLVTRIDTTLRATTGLTFNRAPAGGQSITLGDGAAILTITTAGHEFVNTVNPETVILRAGVDPANTSSGLAQDTNITFTGGFVNEDMEFTLKPTGLAYFTGNINGPYTPLDGPGADEVHFLPARFRVDAMDATASVAQEAATIVVNDAGAGEIVISMANQPLSSDTTAVQVDVTFDVNVDPFAFTFDPDTGASPSLAITGVSNADGEDYTLAYTNNMLSITVPRPRLLASTGDNPEAQGQETITVNFTALTADTYPVVVSGSLRDGSGNPAITFDPDTVAFTARTGMVTLTAGDSTAEATSPTAGEFVLTLDGVPDVDTTVNYFIPPLNPEDAIPNVDYDIVISPGSGDGPSGNPTEGYTGTVDILAGDIDDTTGDGSITIRVVPIDDNIVEGTETVRLRLDGDPPGGVTYMPDTSTVFSVDITDNDDPIVLFGLNGAVLDQGEGPSLREGLIYPIQLFVKDETRLSSVTLGDDKNLVFPEAVTFTLALAPPGTGTPADITIAVPTVDETDSDVSFSDSAGGNLSNSVEVIIPAGEIVSATAYLAITNDAVVDTGELFKIRYSTETVAANTNPVSGESGRVTIGFEALASTNNCAGRTPAIRTAIVNAVKGESPHVFGGAARSDANCANVSDTELGQITTLDLSGAILTSLQPGDFADLTGLTDLVLSGDDVNLRVLPATVFPADLEDNLTTLNLSGNSLTALPANVFDNLAGTYNAVTEVTDGGVVTIDLSGNSLTAAGLPDDVFDDLVALETLNLGDNATLTSLPVGLLDNGAANSGALFDLMSLTLPSAVQGRVNFATNAVTLTQGGTATVTVEIVDAENGNPQSMPITLYIEVPTVAGVSVSNNPLIDATNRYPSSPGFIFIPAGESSVDVTFTADSAAVVDLPRTIGFDFSRNSSTSMVVPDVRQNSNFLSYPSSNVHGVDAIERVRLALFDVGTTTATITATVVAPVALDPTTATATELNNVAANVQLNLGRTAADVGTADVTFTLAGDATLATSGSGTVAEPFLPEGADYLLAVALPDGTAVNATTGTFTLPADVSAATFTVTPIADGFPSSETETVIITITEVDYNGAAAPDADTGLTVAATVTIMDNALEPTATVAADPALITENDGMRGTFTITLTNPPAGEAEVFYTLVVENAAIIADSIRRVGLGGELPAASGRTTGVFTMTAAEGMLAFTAGSDADQTHGEVSLTVNRVEFPDIGRGTDIADPATDTAAITINDDDPVFNICDRTDAVEEAILAAINLTAEPDVGCAEVMNNDPRLPMITSLSVDGSVVTFDTLPVSGDFARLSGLETLDLTDGTFSGGTLTAGIFSGLDDTLTTLNMSRASGTGGTGLTGIGNGAFDSLTGLMELNLSGNAIAGVSDATIFTSLAVLATLNLGGNTTLALEPGALDEVLDTLTSLTWPTQRTARFPAGTSIIVAGNGTATVPVQLDAALPVAVRVPVTIRTGTAPGVVGTTAAIIPAGSTDTFDAVITATNAGATEDGILTIGTPVLITGGTSPGMAPGTPISGVTVRADLIVASAATADLEVISGPTARLTGAASTRLTRGETATFSMVLAGVNPAVTNFTHMEVGISLGGTARNNLTLEDADSVETDAYTIDITSGNVDDDGSSTTVAAHASGLLFYIPAIEFAATDADGDGEGAETVTFTLTIKSDSALANPDNFLSVALASGVTFGVNAINAAAMDGNGDFIRVVPNGDINVNTSTLTYTIVAPATLTPMNANISEGSSQPVTLTLHKGATGPLTIPYTIANLNGANDAAVDYTISPTPSNTPTGGNFTFAVGETVDTISVEAIQDFAVDNDREGLTITLDAGDINGAPIAYPADDLIRSTLTILSGDAAPGTVSLSPTGPEIFESGSNTSTTITVRLNAPAVSGASIVVGYAFNNANTDTASPADYTVSSNDCAPTTPPAPTLSNPCGLAGTLTFEMGAVGQRGDQIKTIMIEANDDDVDESDTPPETLTLTLTSVTGGTVGLGSDDEATITIEERNVVPEDVMKQVETVATVVGTEHVSALTTLIRQRFSATSSFGSLPRAPSGVVPVPSTTTTNLALADNPENMNDMINSMGLERSAQGDSNNQYAIWIRGQRSVFEGTPEVNGLTVDYDGTNTGIGMGAEYSSGGYLAGLAMNYVTTEVDISTESDGETISKYEESMVIAAPYFSLKAGEGTSLWASFGVGTGTADATLATQTKSTDVKLSFLNAGADFTVIGRSFEVVTGLSGLVVRKVVDSFTFTEPEHVLPKTTIDTMQAVGEVTMYRPIPIAGQIVRPYMGISTIHDFGDIVADDDHGLGIRTGVAFGAGRISADIELSSELLRENRRQWTVSGGARFASRPGGQGLSLSLDGTQETQMDAGESVDDDAAQTWGIGLEGGYGMPMGLFHPNGLLTPFTSIDQTGDGRDMSGGMRLSVGNGLSLDLETTRQMHDDSEDASEHKAGLRGQWSF